jgi:hypothetical protein
MILTSNKRKKSTRRVSQDRLALDSIDNPDRDVIIDYELLPSLPPATIATCDRAMRCFPSIYLHNECMKFFRAL